MYEAQFNDNDKQSFKFSWAWQMFSSFNDEYIIPLAIYKAGKIHSSMIMIQYQVNRKFEIQKTGSRTCH